MYLYVFICDDDWVCMVMYDYVVIPRFKMCCDNAMKASLMLVSRCSGASPDVLLASYKQWCQQEGPFAFDKLEEPEAVPEDVQEVGLGEEDVHPNGSNFLLQIQSEACLMSTDVDKMQSFDSEDPDLKGLPDLEQIKKLFEPDHGNGEAPPKNECKIPASLLEAVNMPGCFFNNLWRYCLRLRSLAGGCDLGFLSNPRNVRSASGHLNWYQHHG